MSYDPKHPLPAVTWRKLDVPSPEPGAVHEAARFAVYTGLGGACTPEDQTGIVEDMLDALITNAPDDEVADWLLGVKEGRI